MTKPRDVSDLPVLDFSRADYQAAPFPVLSGWARKWKIARSARGVELLDYDLCRKAIIERSFGTGHPKLIEILGLPEGRPLEYKRRSISFFNRGRRRSDLRRPITRLLNKGNGGSVSTRHPQCGDRNRERDSDGPARRPDIHVVRQDSFRRLLSLGSVLRPAMPTSWQGRRTRFNRSTRATRNTLLPLSRRLKHSSILSTNALPIAGIIQATTSFPT